MEFSHWGDLDLCWHAGFRCENTGWLSIFLLLWPWPWPDDLHIRTWPVFPGDTPDVQIWTSYVKAFESYRLTDRQTESIEIINHAASRVVNQSFSWLRPQITASKLCSCLSIRPKRVLYSHALYWWLSHNVGWASTKPTGGSSSGFQTSRSVTTFVSLTTVSRSTVCADILVLYAGTGPIS